jgi:hypothetical protein
MKPPITVNVIPGVCTACGCTDHRACIDDDGFPCHWVDPWHTLCSACDFDGDPDLTDDEAAEVIAGMEEALGDVPEAIDLGPCCACGATGPSVRNILMLPRRAPVPGTGWGCLQCGLPPDGASAILCDDCAAAEVAPREVIAGYPAAKGRAPIGDLIDGGFDHRRDLHPEVTSWP